MYLKKKAEQLSESLKALSADEVREQDNRPPILYLRSFEDDTGLLPKHEENLVTALAPFGPMIGIGRPGEFFQTLGVARVYCGDDWQGQIRDWVNVAGMVVIRIGESQGLRWEIDTVVASLKPTRLLLQLPNALSEKEADLIYRVVRSITGRNGNHDYKGVKYIYFDDGLKPHFIKAQLATPERSAQDERSLELRRFYKHMFSNALENYWRGQEREREKRRFFNWRDGPIQLLTILVFALAGLVAGYFVIGMVISGALIGLLGGVVVGFIISTGIVWAVRYFQGEHD